MGYSMTDKNISDFAARLKEKFSVKKFSEVKMEEFAGFNSALYSSEFNAERFSDSAKIAKWKTWEFDTNPAAKKDENLWWGADYGGRLIGQFHIIPAEVNIRGGHYRCAWGSGLAISEKYRNIGVSSILVQEVRRKVAENFALFLLGGMNENSYNFFKKSGFIDLGKIPRYVKILDFKSVLEYYGVPSLISSFLHSIYAFLFKRPAGRTTGSVEVVDTFDEEFNGFWSSISHQYICIAKRDAKFLKWKYIDQPFWKYTILKLRCSGSMKGYAVIRDGKIKSGKLKDMKIGIITDMLIDPSSTKYARHMITAITEFFEKKKAGLVKCDILNDVFAKALKASSFLRRGSGGSFMLEKYNSNIPESLKRENWFITSGDSDLDYD